jgi:serine/threonine protein kinase
MKPAAAASLGQLAVVCRMLSEPEHLKLRRLVQVRAKGKRPTSFARLLIKAGFGARTVRRLLRLGVDLAAVRCDGCGKVIPQEELPPRKETPCARCGALVIGFAGFRKRDDRPLAASGSSIWDSSGSGSGGEHTLVADGVRLPTLDALMPPPSGASALGEGDATSTLAYTNVLNLPDEELMTLPFEDVLALPAVGRSPRSDEETIVAFDVMVAERAPKAAAASRGTVRLKDPYSTGAAQKEQVGDWELLRPLGEGGVGKVYLARHVTRGDKAALKVLRPEVVRDGEYVERFRREADAALRIRHPNVVGFIEAGTEAKGGRQFIAYEYVDGGSLLDVLSARGTLAEKEALAITRGIALALGVADAQSIVHRDVKPENILLTSTGDAKLADLGLIRETSRMDTRLTQAGIVVGTPCYMAPEQALGEDSIDVRADIYALGLCLWQMLAGSVPFEDDGELPAIELMTKHIEEDLPDVRIERPAVSDATAQLVKAMTARDKAARYPNPQTLVRDVDLCLAGKLPLGPRVVVASSSSGSGSGERRAGTARQQQKHIETVPEAPHDVLAVTQEAPPPAAVELAAAAEKGSRPAAFFLLVALLVLTPVSCVVTAVVLWMKFGDRLRGG